LLHTLYKPVRRELNLAIGAFNHNTFECVFQSDITAILLAQQSSDYWALLLACGMTGDVIRDGEDDEGVELDMKPGVGGLLREKRV
jgi:hypothetical protein